MNIAVCRYRKVTGIRKRNFRRLMTITATASRLSIDNILLEILNVFDHSFWSSSE